MQRIHRRKNEDIVKDFVCIHDCGKAYGSYAALYTHIKNKHPNVSTLIPSEIKHIKPKATGRKGRPIKKQKDQRSYLSPENDYECRICQEENCVCSQEINNDQVDKTIDIMQNTKFVQFINCIGKMQIQDRFTWIRNTEDEPICLSTQQIGEMYTKFIENYDIMTYTDINMLWLSFLSFSSRYWDGKYIDELYNSIFAIMLLENDSFFDFIASKDQFSLIRLCQQQKNEELNQLIFMIVNK